MSGEALVNRYDFFQMFQLRMVRSILMFGESSKLINLIGYSECVKLALQAGSENRVRSLACAAAGSTRSNGTGTMVTVDGRLFIIGSPPLCISVFRSRLSDLGKPLYKLINMEGFGSKKNTLDA